MFQKNLIFLLNDENNWSVLMNLFDINLNHIWFFYSNLFFIISIDCFD